MKKLLSIAWGLALLASVTAAPVWEGSAVAGGAGDFPDDGLYGACNSFPRDAKIEVHNLENGKSVTVVITRNVENPGVFIALSPKAAIELGMRSGSAARIRAVALSLSTSQTSLPPPRAGTSSDPDFNPKVFVAREKAAAAAATTTLPSTSPPTPAVAAPTEAVPTETLPSEAASPVTEAQPAEPVPETATETTPAGLAPVEIAEAAPASEQPPEAVPEEAAPAETEAVAEMPAETGPTEAVPTEAATAEIEALVPAAIDEVTVESTPIETAMLSAETEPAEALPDETAAEPETAAIQPVEEPASPADILTAEPEAPAVAEAPAAMPEEVQPAIETVTATEPETRPHVDEPSRDLASESQNAPRPGPVGMNLPSPDESPAPSAVATPEPRIFPDILPDLYGDSIPRARLSAAPPFGLLAPAIVEGAGGSASSVGILRPSIATDGEDEAMYEPEPAQPSPDSLPPSLLTRLEAPPWVDPNGSLGENDIDMSAILAANTAESTPLEQPSTDLEVADASLAEPSPSMPSAAEPIGEAPAETEPEAPPAAPIPIAETVPREIPITDEGQPASIAGNGNLPVPATVEAGLQESPPAFAETAASDAGIIEPSIHVAEDGGELLIGLEPTAPRPPSLEHEASPVAAQVTTLPAAPEALAVSPVPSGEPTLALPAFLGTLAKDSYYVQIGVFASFQTLEGIMRGYTSLYPFLVEKANLSSGAPVYRLYIGPLTRDESGTVLMKIKAMGVKDAFLKKGS